MAGCGAPTGRPALTFLVCGGAWCGAWTFLAPLRRMRAQTDRSLDPDGAPSVAAFGAECAVSLDAWDGRDSLNRTSPDEREHPVRRHPEDQQGGRRRDPCEGGMLMRGASRLRSEGWLKRGDSQADGQPLPFHRTHGPLRRDHDYLDC
jgi:hypothetical protein